MRKALELADYAGIAARKAESAKKHERGIGSPATSGLRHRAERRGSVARSGVGSVVANWVNRPVR